MDLIQLLNDREERWKRKTEILRCTGKTVVSLTLRMPNEIRRTKEAERVLERAAGDVQALLTNAFGAVSCEGMFLSCDGPYALFSVAGGGIEVKKALIRFEEESRFGEVIDADVMTNEDKEISRTDVGGKERTCLVCGGSDARLCVRNKSHSREDTEKIIYALVIKKLYQGE